MATDLGLKGLKGVGDVTAKKLTDAGIIDVMSVLVHGANAVQEAMGCDGATARDVVDTARRAVEDSGVLRRSIRTASEILSERQDIKRISTGSSETIDGFLSGGIETRAVTEVYGEYNSGKSQLCHSMAVQVQRPVEDGGLGRRCIYIDTENTFRPERIATMAEERGMDPKAALDGITVANALNAQHQQLLLDTLSPQIEELNAGLIVVDSITNHFRAEYIGQAWLARRQQALNAHLHQLSTVAELYNVAVLLANQVVALMGGPYGPKQGPTGGTVLGHASTYRIEIKKMGAKRMFIMVDSPCDARIEAIAYLGRAGIVDTEDGKKRRPAP